LVNIAVIFHVAIHSEANRANSKTHANNFHSTMPFIRQKIIFNAIHSAAIFRGWVTDHFALPAALNPIFSKNGKYLQISIFWKLSGFGKYCCNFPCCHSLGSQSR